MQLSDILLLVIVFGALAFLWKRGLKGGGEASDVSKDIASLKGYIEGINQNVSNLSRSVDERLKESTKAVQQSQKNMGERLDNASKSYAEVRGQLEKMTESNKRIYDLGKDIASLQDTLKAPKLRGVWGELFLEEMLRDRFSKEQYQMQYKFKSGQTVDAVIFLRDKKFVPVDSKFSLENFKRLIEIEEELHKEKTRKIFFSDVKKRIDEIAERYIIPEEGTMNFALMYIPAENVYYEIMVRGRETGSDLMEYALSRSVFPVSPNTFSLYLTTILGGLRGLEIEKQTQEMMTHLNALDVSFGKFSSEYQLLGKHLSHASRTYEDGEKQLDKVQTRLQGLGGDSQTRSLK